MIINGGKFSSDPTAYLAPGLTAEQVGDYWVVLNGTSAVASITRGGVVTNYATLASAIDAAAAGETVKLINNVELDATQTISKNLALDLNGKTVTNNGTGYAFNVAGAAVTVKNGTIDGTGRGIYATGAGANLTLGETSAALNVTTTGRALGLYNGAKATLTADSKLSTSVNGDVTVFISKDTAFDVYGTVEQTSTGDSYDNNAISGNGNSDDNGISNHSGTSLHLYSGAVVTSNSAVAIYQPQIGNTTIDSGATVTGASGIGIKAGTLTVNGSTITGNGAYVATTPFSNGIKAEGSAIIVEGKLGSPFCLFRKHKLWRRHKTATPTRT